MRLAIGLSLLLLLSGCLTNGGTAEEAEKGAIERASPYFELLELDRTVSAHGMNWPSYNLQRITYHNGVDDTGAPSQIPAGGYYTEFAVTKNYAYMGGASANGEFGGFSIIALQNDAEGRPHPKFMSHFPGFTASDLEVNADESLAFLGTQRNSVEEVMGATFTDVDAAANTRGIYVVDIADKIAPELLEFMPLPYNGVHTFSYHQHANGNEYLIATTYDLGTSISPVTGAPPVLPPGPNPATQRVIVYQIAAESPMLRPVGTYQLQGESGNWVFPHDTSIHVHPETNATIMYVSYWDAGVRIIDFSDPENMAELSRFTDFSPSQFNAIHWARPSPDAIAGKQVLVAEPEIIQSPDETGQLTFVDITDPSFPKKLGHWSLPFDIGVEVLDTSPHNFDWLNGKVALAHNHAGIWVIDVSDADKLQQPRTVAYTLDAMERENNPRLSPYFWGVHEQDGLLWAIDEGTGLYAFKYTGPN